MNCNHPPLVPAAEEVFRFDAFLEVVGVGRKGITEQVIRSSGNVFADMGLPDAAELDTKARLGAALNLIVERQRLTLAEVATALGTNQPEGAALALEREVRR